MARPEVAASDRAHAPSRPPTRAALDLELVPLELLEQMSVPVFVTCVAGDELRPEIVFVNDSMLRLLGYRREEIVGRGPEVWQVTSMDDVDTRALGAALQGGRKIRMATVARSKDGVERALRIEMSPHKGSWWVWVVHTVVWMSDDDPEDTGTIRINPERPQEFQVGELVLTPSTRSARNGARTLELTPSENVVLAALMEQRGCVVERSVLHHELWGSDPSVRSRAVDVYVGSLRRKLRDLGASDVIQTVRGVGYLVHE